MLYNPPAFRVDDLAKLFDHIDNTGLATLVTVGPDGPLVSHVPLLLERDTGEKGKLIGHVARANPQWRDSDLAKSAVAIFMGPDAYVTPSSYPSKQQHGRVVPTWNYTVVHARGTLQFFDDPARLRGIVERLTDRHEGRRAAPWKVSDAPARFIDSQLAAIVGFELLVTALEGKYKLSQNRDPADQAGVVAGLAREDDAGSIAVGALMTPKPL